MAKIRLRMDTCEVEIESRDFYVDNDTAATVIACMAESMQGMAAPRAQVLAAPKAAAEAASAGTADAGAGAGGSGRGARGAGGSRPLPPFAAAASTAAAAPTIEPAAARAPRAADEPPPPGHDLSSVLDGLDEAEAFEPEFDGPPRRVSPSEVAARLRVLAADGFFGEPRTVSEAADGMAERGWLAGPLDVSKALARMAMGREMRRETRGYKAYYCCETRGAEPAPPLEPPVPS